MPIVSITISDELASRLQAKYGTLAELRDATRAIWSGQVKEEAISAFRKTETELRMAGLLAAIEAEDARLDGIL